MNLFWTTLRLKLLLFNSERVRKGIAKKYCRKGFHHVRNGFLSHGHSGKDHKMHTKKVHYISCQFCNYMFFASPKDKSKYLEMTAKERSAFRGLLSRTLLKQYSGGGSDPKKDASASSSSDT